MASPTYSVGAVGFVPDLGDVPYLDASAALSEDGQLTVFLVNRSLDRTLPVDLTMDAYTPAAIAGMVLTGPRYDATNDGPDASPVSPADVEVRLAAPTSVQLPPCSLTVLRLRQ